MVTPGFPVTPDLLADLLAMPDGTAATVEQIERFDIGKLYLDAQDFAGAIERLDGLEILSARNNRAMALFHLGRIDEALAGFMAAWEADTDNLFALGWAVRLRLYRGDEVGAQGLTIPLAGATARRLDDALLQLDALLLLRQDAVARDAFTRYTQCDWFEIGEGYSRALLHHFAACAASRLGSVSDALGLWREALALTPDFKLALHNSAGFERDHQTFAYPSVFDLARALPLTLARVPDHAVAKGNLVAIRSAQGRHQEAEQLLREVVADHPDYLCARCNLANLVILDGKLDQADELLKGLAARQRIHIHDLFILYGSMALLNRARGEREVADSLIASLERMVQNEDDARQLKFAKNLQRSIGRGASVAKAISALARLARNPKRGQTR